MSMTPRDRLADLERLAELGGGEERLRRQRDAGKLTTRERVDLLFDPGTFEEVDKLVTHRCRDFGLGDEIVPGDGVVAGYGRVDGRAVCAFAQDLEGFRALGARGEGAASRGPNQRGERAIDLRRRGIEARSIEGAKRAAREWQAEQP